MAERITPDDGATQDEGPDEYHWLEVTGDEGHVRGDFEPALAVRVAAPLPSLMSVLISRLRDAERTAMIVSTSKPEDIGDLQGFAEIMQHRLDECHAIGLAIMEKLNEQRKAAKEAA